MKFSEQWLRSLCNPPLTTAELCDKLTMGGFERTYRHGPGLNSDQAAILAELAFDEPAIEALRVDGAFGVVDGDDPDGRPVSEPG